MEKKRLNIGVIGAGKWGQALYYAYKQNNKVLITSRTKRDIDNFVSLDEVLNCEYLIISISTQTIYSWMYKNFIDRGQNILVASKGIDVNSGKFLHKIYADFIDENRLAFISGPSFAEEVQKSYPTALIISSKNLNLAQKYVNAFPSFIKGYISDDVIGAEISGAYKNIIAISAGVCDGLKLGNNAKASLISRGLVEMSRFGQFFGAKTNTFLSLGGAGDLFLTCSSNLSRNYRVGIGLSQNKKLEDILKNIGEIAEGISTTIALYKIAIANNLYTPITKEVYLMIKKNKKPMDSVKDLLLYKI